MQRRRVNIDDPLLAKIGRKSRQPAQPSSVQQPPPQQQHQDQRLTRLDPTLIESLDRQHQQKRASFMKSVKASAFYTPLLFASFGGLMGSIICNYCYVNNPPAVTDERACAKDRRERTLTATLVGAIFGAGVYLFMFARKTTPPSTAAIDYAAADADFEDYDDYPPPPDDDDADDAEFNERA